MSRNVLWHLVALYITVDIGWAVFETGELIVACCLTPSSLYIGRPSFMTLTTRSRTTRRRATA